MGGTQSAQRLDETHAAAGEREEPEQVEDAEAQLRDKPIKVQLSDIDGKEGVSLVNTNGHYEDTKAEDGEETFETINITDKDVSNEGSGVGEQNITLEVTSMEAKQNDINDSFRRFFSSIGFRLTVNQPKTQTEEPSAPDNTGHPPTETGEEKVGLVELKEEEKSSDPTVCSTLIDVTSDDLRDNTDDQTPQRQVDAAAEAASSTVGEASHVQQDTKVDEEQRPTSPSSHDWEVLGSPMKKFFTTGIFSGLRKKKKTEDLDTTGVGGRERETSKVADEDRQKESGPVEEAAAQDKDKEKVETQEEKAMEPEIVSSLEKERVQASPLRRLFASPSLRRFAKKQQEKIPSEPGEHASDEQTSDERSKDEDSKETKVEENSAWASFKKLMTPKKTLKKPDEEPQTEQAQKLSDGDKLSDSSSEQSRKRKDSSVSWEAVLCGSGRRRSNRNSQEELPGTNHSKSKNDRAADEESEDAGASSLKQAEHSPDSEGGFTWNSFKRLITPKRKAREDEDAGSKFIVLMTQDELSVPAESDVKSARKARDEAATAESDEESETPAVIPLSEFQDDLIPAEEKTHVPMDENATQRSDSPALDSEDPKVEDLAAVSEMKVILDEFTEAISKHPQLSDIPEESAVPETMAPPVEEEPAGDDTLAEDLTDITSDAITAPEPADFTLTDETEMMSAVSQLSESPKSGASTPVPAYYSLEETEKVLAQVVETISAATLMTPLSSEEVNVERIVGSISNQSLATVFKDEPALLEIHRKSDTSNIQTGLNVEEMVGEKNVEATVELESLSGISKALYTEMTSEVAPEDLEQAEMAVDEVLVLQSEEVQIQHAGSKTKVEDSELMSEESGVEGALKEADEGEDLKVAMVDELQIERSDLKETVVQTMEIFISTAEPVTDTEEVGHEEELSPLTDVNKTHDEECHDRSTDSSMVVSGDGPHADSAGGEKQETPAEESIVSTEEHNAQIVKKEKPLNDLSGDRQTDNESESEPLEDLKTQRTTEAESEAGKQQHLQESIDHDQEPDQAKSEESCGPLSASKERPLGATPQGEILEEHPALDDQVLVEESSGEPGELTTSGSEGFLTETTPEEPEGKQTDVSGDNMTQETQEMESSVETQETVSEVEVLSGDSLDMGKCPTETKAEKDGGEAESVPDQNVQKNRALEHWSRGTGEEDTRQVKDMAEHPPPSTLISPPQELQAPQTEPVVDPEDAPCVEEVSSEETTPGPSEEAETDSVSEDKLLREETDEKDSDLEETPDMTAVESVVQRSEESEERFDSNSVQKEETREAATEPVDSVGLSSQDVLSMVIPERGLVTGSEEAQSPVQHHTPEFSDAMEAAGKVELKLSQSEVTDTTQPRETEDTVHEEVEKEQLLVETAKATTLDTEQSNAESGERVTETEAVFLVEAQGNRVETESPEVEPARKTSAGSEQRDVEVSGVGNVANTDQSEEPSSIRESTKEQSPVEKIDCASEDTEETDVVSEDAKEKTEDPESVKCSIENVETSQPDQPSEEDLSAPEVLSEKEADVTPENESSLNPEQCFTQITESVVREAPAQTVQAEDLRDQEVETPKDEDTSPDSVDHIDILTHTSEDSVDLEDTNTAPAEKQDDLSNENLPLSILIRPEEPEAPQTLLKVPTEETTPGPSEEVEKDPVSDEKLLREETDEKHSDIEETPDMTAVESVVQRSGESEERFDCNSVQQEVTREAGTEPVDSVGLSSQDVVSEVISEHGLISESEGAQLTVGGADGTSQHSGEETAEAGTGSGSRSEPTVDKGFSSERDVIQDLSLEDVHPELVPEDTSLTAMECSPAESENLTVTLTHVQEENVSDGEQEASLDEEEHSLGVLQRVVDEATVEELVVDHDAALWAKAAESEEQKEAAAEEPAHITECGAEEPRTVGPEENAAHIQPENVAAAGPASVCSDLDPPQTVEELTKDAAEEGDRGEEHREEPAGDTPEFSDVMEAAEQVGLELSQSEGTGTIQLKEKEAIASESEEDTVKDQGDEEVEKELLLVETATATTLDMEQNNAESDERVAETETVSLVEGQENRETDVEPESPQVEAARKTSAGLEQREVEVSGEGDKANTDQSEERSSLQESTKEQSPVENVDCASEDTEETDVVSEDTKEKTEDPESVKCSIANVETPQPDQPREEDLSAPEVLSEKEAVRDPDVAPENESSLNPEQCFAQITETVVREAPAQTVQAEDLRDQEVETPKDEDTSPDSVDHIYIQTHPSEDSVDLEDTNTAPAEKQDELSKENLPPSILIRPEEPEAPQTDSAVDPEDTPSVEEVPTEETTPGLSEEVENDPVSDEKLLTGETHEKDSDIEETPDMTAVESVVQRPGDSEDKHHQEVLRRKTTMDAEQSYVETVECAPGGADVTDIFPKEATEVAVVEERGPQEDSESLKCCQTEDTPQPDRPSEEDLSAPEDLKQKEAVMDPDVAPENESSLNPEQCFAQITESVVRECPAQTVQAEDLRDQEVETPRDEDTSPVSVDHQDILTHASEDSVDLEDTITAPAEKQDDLSNENLPPSILIRPEEPEAPQTEPAVDPEDTPSVEEITTEETTPGPSEEVEKDKISDGKLLREETDEKDSDIEETPDMTAVESVVQRSGESEDKHHQEVLRRKTTMDAEQSYVETAECAPGGADVTDIFPEKATEEAVVEERGPQEDSESLKCCQTEDTPQPDRPSEEDLSAPEDLKQKEAVMDPDVAPENESSLNPEQCFAQITESVVREAPAQTVQAEDLRDQEVEMLKDEDTSPVSVDHQDILTHTSEDSVDLEDTNTAPAEKQDDLSKENVPLSILIRPEEPEAPQTDSAVDPCVEKVPCEETPGPSEEAEMAPVSDEKLLREETDEKELVPEDTSLTAESENLTVTLTQVQEENVSDGEQEASLDEEEHSLGVLQRVVDEATAEELVVDHDAALWAKAAETEEQKEAAAEEPAHKTECGVEEPRTENPEENAAHIQPENEEAPAAGPAAVCSDLDPPQAVEELTKEAEEEGVRGEEQIEDPAGDTPEFSDAMEAAEQVELELSQSEVTGTPQVEDEEEVVTGGEHREEQASGLKAVDGTDSTEDAARAVKEELSTGGIPEDQTPGTEATSEQEMRPADQETQDSLQVERSWESEQLNVQVVERAVEEALQEEVLQDVLKEETQIDDTKTYVVESEQRREAGGCGPVSEVAADGPHEEQPPASAAAGECRVQTARSVEEEKGQDRVPGTTVKKEILAASGDQIHHPEASEDSDVRSKEDAEETGKSRGIPAGDAVEEGGHRTGTKSDEPAEDTEQSRIHIAKRDEDVGMKSETVLVGTNLVQPTEGVSQVEPEEDQTSTDLCEDKEESQAMKRDSASLEPEPRNELPCRVEQKEGQAEESEAVEVWRRAELLIQRKPHHHHSPSTEPDDIVEAAPEPHTDTAAPTRKEVFAVEDTQGKRCPRPAAESEESEDMMVAGHSQQHHPSLITVQLETKLVQREEPRNTVGALSMSATEAYLSTEESSLIPETISFKENVLTHGAEVTEELKATALPCEEQKEYSGEVASPDVEAHEAEPAAAADLSDVSPPQCRTDRALELKKIIVTSTMHLAHVMKETVEEIRVVTVPHVEGEDERESTVHLMSGVKIMESTHLHTSFGRKNEDVLQHVEEQHETPTEALMDLEENDGKPRSVSDHSKDQRCEEMDEEDQRDGLQLSSDPDQVGETSEADEEAPMFEYLANNVSMEGPCLETTTPESGTIPTAEKAALQVPELSVRVDEAQDFLDLSLSEAAPEDEAQIEKMEEPDRQSASKETAVIFSPLVIVIQAIQETEDDLRRATGRQRAPEKLAKSQVDGSEQASAKDDEDVWLDAEESILTEEEEAVSHVEEFVDADEEEGEEQGEASDSFEIAPDHSAEVKESVADTLLETASDTEEFTAALEDPDVPTTTVAIAE